MMFEGRNRAIITKISPQVEGGLFPAKKIIYESIRISADIFADGHFDVAADLLYRKKGEQEWKKIPLVLTENDRFEAFLTLSTLGFYEFTIEAWVDHFKTWQKDLLKKIKGNISISLDLQVGKQILEQASLQELLSNETDEKLTEILLEPSLQNKMRDRFPSKQWVTLCPHVFNLLIEPSLANFSAWYELFPRSNHNEKNEHGTFKQTITLLPEIAKMGFDILYLPPIHPIGFTKRRGKNNQPQSVSVDPGSPWAIGSSEGGHTAIHPKLGTLEDFKEFLQKAKKLNLDIALDLAFQCSPDHPYIQQHPEWFKFRPDQTLQYAENPPKKYEDITAFDFESEQWWDLWNELKEVVLFWIKQGVYIFRVDNPHTKPFPFWAWLIYEIKTVNPQVIFLSEAFTRPKVMDWLAKVGFTQSYTYFTWRHTKKEIIDYVLEVTLPEKRDYFRPNFWPNTPDILPEELQHGGKPAFMIRYLLAATLSSNYGIYGPAFELLIDEAIPGTEEYLNAEKYEIKTWDHTKDNLNGLISEINRLRKENSALQQTANVQFLDIDNENLLAYIKKNNDETNILIMVISLDPFLNQSGNLQLPLKELGIPTSQSFKVHELITNRRYIWKGEFQKIALNPQSIPASIFKLQKQVRRESDFDYFM